MRYFSTNIEILKLNDLFAKFYNPQATKHKDFDCLEGRNIAVDEFASYLLPKYVLTKAQQGKKSLLLLQINHVPCVKN